MSSKNTNSLIIKISNGMIELPAHISLDQKARKKLEQQSKPTDSQAELTKKCAEQQNRRQQGLDRDDGLEL
ncbi:hypothetical protein GYV61_02920 [Lactobacillus melliventris]|uniref:hypothetical protein n=1 Tax=Lactobacillus melliventris TaxID=1218507 RepID=UPI0015802585|nr:hypothetical protein [Lactobacillus melliventris]NUE97699.1 hypothetical protein [Lactobacillus melliventris]